jgi:uncharacterized protein (TIGR03435 family)
VKSSAVAALTLTLVEGELKLMAWTKQKTAIVASVGILLAAGTATVAVKTVHDHSVYSWEVADADMRVFYRAQPQVVIVPTIFPDSENGFFGADGRRGAIGIAQPFINIVQFAYQKHDLRIVIATDLPSGRFDYIAKLVNPPAINTNWTIALQKEIIRKFGITGRIALMESNVLVLKADNNGIRGFKVSHNMPNGQARTPIIEQAQNGLKLGFAFHEQPVSTLIRGLESRLKIPVVDQTGLTQDYDFALTWNMPYPTQRDLGELELPDLEKLLPALRDQLGLELVPTNMPNEMLVVEKAK